MLLNLDTIVRRCCTWNCGTSNSVNQYEGREIYFCSKNLCNGIGAESALTTFRGTDKEEYFKLIDIL